MSIASEILALTSDRNAIRAALIDQGIDEAADHGFDDFAEDIANIIGTGGNGSAIVITETPDSHGGTILEVTAVDLSGDTVTPARLKQGITAHNAAGQPIVGTMTGGGGANYQSKTVVPTKSEQTVTPDIDYDALNSVTVSAIPAIYQDTSQVNATASDVLSGKKIVNSVGTVITGNLVVQHYYTGSGTPSSTLGANGDIYLQTS